MPGETNVKKPHAHAHQSHNGFIVFCEKNLRYEKGIKAWIFLGPYLLGALGLEMMIDPGHPKATTSLWPWIGFLAYLVLFPSVWRQVLKFFRFRKKEPIVAVRPSAFEMP